MNDSLFETLVATQNLVSYLRPSKMSFIVMNTITIPFDHFAGQHKAYHFEVIKVPVQIKPKFLLCSENGKSGENVY